jgi:two-component system, chemotaxis family, protein-glutamate methylesterase/glutaminase
MKKYEAIVIGGSVGGMDAVSEILSGLPESFGPPIVIVLHRLKNVQSSLIYLLDQKTALEVREIADKDLIENNKVYVAPANYHTLIEKERFFSLDCSPPVKFCRPSADVLFESAAQVYKDKLIGIILTGANDDGSAGLKAVSGHGGLAIVQDPSTAVGAQMPLAAIEAVSGSLIMKIDEIKSYLLKLA